MFHVHVYQKADFLLEALCKKFSRGKKLQIRDRLCNIVTVAMGENEKLGETKPFSKLNNLTSKF